MPYETQIFFTHSTKTMNEKEIIFQSKYKFKGAQSYKQR